MCSWTREAAPVKASAEARIDCGTSEAADAVLQALGPENGEFVATKREGHVLVLTASADGPAALRRALDDALACATAALRTLGAAKAAPDPEDE